MPEKDNDKNGAPPGGSNNENKKPPENAAPRRERKFTKTRLRKDCYQLFSVSTSTFDGATRNVKGQHTIAAMAEIIKKWLGEDAVLAMKKEGK